MPPFHELGPPLHLTIPCRFALIKSPSPAEETAEIERLAVVISDGIQALSGVYMRLVSTLRVSQLPSSELRTVLERHLPQPRVSELLRVAQAPEEIYRRYAAGFFGFKAALSQVRGYRVHDSDWLRKRQMRRAAERLAHLATGRVEIHVAAKTVTVTEQTEQDRKHPRLRTA